MRIVTNILKIEWNSLGVFYFILTRWKLSETPLKAFHFITPPSLWVFRPIKLSTVDFVHFYYNGLSFFLVETVLWKYPSLKIVKMVSESTCLYKLTLETVVAKMPIKIASVAWNEGISRSGWNSSHLYSLKEETRDGWQFGPLAAKNRWSTLKFTFFVN